MFQAFHHVSVRHALKSFTALGLIYSAMVPGLASAAESAKQTAQAGLGIEEITVTARRREENIQSVPISITAFSAEDLREKNITTSRELAALTPTYTENPVYGRDAGGFDRIRGLPGVRSYFAEAPISPSANQGGVSGRGGFYDLDNVQVLVGPQGTLFGINAIGGAILREPKRPTDKLEGYVEGLYGTYNDRMIGGAINVPAGDKLSFRLAGQREVRGGFTKIKNTGLSVDDVSYSAFRFGVTVKPFENIESYTVIDARQSENHGPSRFLLAVKPGSFAQLVFGAALVNSVAAQAALGKSVQLGASYSPENTFEKSKYLVVVNNTKWDVTDTLTVKNIFSYSNTNNVEQYDWDGTVSPVIDPYADSRAYPAAQNNYSEELQFQGKFLDGKVNAVVGGFASYDGYPNPRTTCNGLIIFFAKPSCTENRSITRAQAVFAQATVNMSVISPALEKLNFTAGYRYNWDYQKLANLSKTRNLSACTSAVANPATCFIVQSNSWTAPGWTFGLDYQFDQGRMAYITASKAYSRGGFNSANLPIQVRIVQPQFNTNLEGGVKADWDLGSTRLRTNVSVFHNWFDNVQENVTGSYVDAQGNQKISGLLLNAAKVHVIGAELTMQWILSEEFEVSGSYAYSHAKYVKYDSVNPTTGAPESFTNRRFPFHADHSGNVTLKYNLPVDKSLGRMSVSATASLMSDEVPLDDGAPVQPFNRSKMDLRADWNEAYGYPVDFSISATNVTNRRYTMIGFNLYNTVGILTTNYSEPRMVTVSARYRF